MPGPDKFIKIRLGSGLRNWTSLGYIWPLVMPSNRKEDVVYDENYHI